jgi:hypothetical protein
VQEEIKKCELLCAMCHRLAHKPEYPQNMIMTAIEAATGYSA